MKRNIQMTIDEDLCAELRQTKNFSALVNDLIKEYFGKMKAQSVSEIQTEINQTKREETNLKKNEKSLDCNLEPSEKETNSIKQSEKISGLILMSKKLITKLIRGTDGK